MVHWEYNLERDVIKIVIKIDTLILILYSAVSFLGDQWQLSGK